MQNTSKQRAAIILAAGQGTRMKSPVPKVLHKVGGRSMLDRAIDAATHLGCERIIVVVGHHSPSVRQAALARVGEANIAVQDPPLGTAHAVLSAKEALKDFEGDVIITYADCPLMSAEVLSPAFEKLASTPMAVMAFEAKVPGAYGRMITQGDDELMAIVEAKEATQDQLLISLCNSGVLACDKALLFALLAEVNNHNAKGEYYLTDVVGLAVKAGHKPRYVVADEADVGGVNAQTELAEMEAIWQNRQRQALMIKGVTMTAPETVFVSWDSQIDAGVIIEPHVVIAEGVTIKTGAVIRAFSHLEGAFVDEGALIGPYARLRPKAHIGKSVHIGNFVEVKNVTLGEGAKANHLSYLGDGEVGPRSNIGAGTIFCNYDGYFKHKTHIGADVFIGSNTLLVAPVRINDGAMTGSGSVITRDIDTDALGLARAPQIEKSGWAKDFRLKKKALKDAKS